MAFSIPLLLAAGAAGAGVAGAAAAAATTGLFLGIGAWGWAAISVGISILGTVAQTLLSPTPPKPGMAEGDVPIRQAIPPRVRLYGRQRMGGSLLYYDSTSDGDLKNLICHCAHEVDDSTEATPNPEEDWLNDERVQLDDGGNVTDDPWWQGDDSTVVVKHYLGTPTQVVPSFDPKWTANHKAHGLNCSYVKYADLKDEDQIRVFPSGPPPYRAVFRGAKVFDPRDGSQTAGTESTYKYSDNLALIVLDYLTRTETGVPVGFGVKWSRINIASFATAAAVCDQLIPLKNGGTEKRWRGWGSYQLTEDRKDVLTDLLDGCGGRLTQGPDGTLGLVVGSGQYRATSSDPFTVPLGVPDAAVTLGQDQLFGWDLTNGKTALDRINEVRATYVSEAWEWQETEAGIQQDQDGIDRNGTESSEIKLRFVPAESQAQRCARETLRRGNPTWTGTVRTTLAGLDAWGERWIRLQIAELSIDQIFEIVTMRLDRETMMVEIDVASYDGWWDWTAADDEKDPAIPPPETDDDDHIPVPTGVHVDIASRLVNSQTFVAVGVIHWDPPPRAVFVARARYRPKTTPESPWQALPVAQDEFQIETGPLADGTLYEAQVRFIAPRGGGGAWSASANFTAVADPIAPPSPVNLIAQANVPTASQVTVSATAPNSPRHAALRFYRNSTATFAGSTLVGGGPFYGAPGETKSFVDNPGVGDWYYFATSGNWSNVESTPAGPVLAEAAPPAPAITSPTTPSTTNDNRLPISGIGATGATIKLFANAVQVGTGTVVAGNWTVTPTSAYGNGVNAVTATQTLAGNESVASGAVSLTVNALDTDARTYIDAMTTRPTSARMGDINTLVTALKSASIWTKIDHLHLLAAHHEQASRLSLKTPGTFTLVALAAGTPSTSPTFTVDRGWLGAGADATIGGYLAGSFNPVTGTNQFAQDSAHLAVWVHQASSGLTQGNYREAGGGQALIATKNPTALLWQFANAAAADTVAQTGDGTGFYAWSRQSSASFHAYQGTTDLGTITRTSAAPISGAFNILRGGSRYSNARVAAACWGSGLSGTEITALYDALHTYLVAVGAAS